MTKRLGVQTTVKSVASGLFCTTLRIMANKLPPTERAKPKQVRGAAASAAHKKLDMTDEQVIEARRLYEEEGARPKDLAERYGVNYARITQILQYRTRTFGMP